MLRRSFLTGMVSLLAAPAIVRASSLMPISSTLIFSGGSYPAVCDRIPVMLNGVIRYLKVTDEMLLKARPLYSSYGIEEWIETRKHPMQPLSKPEGAEVVFRIIDWTQAT